MGYTASTRQIRLLTSRAPCPTMTERLSSIYQQVISTDLSVLISCVNDLSAYPSWCQSFLAVIVTYSAPCIAGLQYALRVVSTLVEPILPKLFAGATVRFIAAMHESKSG